MRLRKIKTQILKSAQKLVHPNSVGKAQAAWIHHQGCDMQILEAFAAAPRPKNA